MKKPAIIVDLDGTLAIFEGVRSGLDFSDVTNDKINKPIKIIIDALNSLNFSIIILSGRPEYTLKQTKQWLKKHRIKYEKIILKDEPGKKDWETKKEIYEKEIAPYYDVIFILEDRNNVVKMWREMGLTCLQVNETNY
jgi:FMN phosphatase YigB (HAD superfamily)